MISTAVVLAAGKGTRLGALSAENPKPLLRIGVRPVIDIVIDALTAAGIPRVVVVTGHLAGQLELHLSASYGDIVRFARQDEPHGTAHALLEAAPLLDETRPFFLAWGDIVTAPEDYRDVLDAWRDGVDAVCGVNAVEDPSSGAAVVVDAGGRVKTIVEKPPSGSAPSRWNNSGLMVLGPAVWPHLRALTPSPRGELEIPDAINALVEAGGVVAAAEVSGPWFDIGTPDGLAAARVVYG